MLALHLKLTKNSNNYSVFCKEYISFIPLEIFTLYSTIVCLYKINKIKKKTIVCHFSFNVSVIL